MNVGQEHRSSDLSLVLFVFYFTTFSRRQTELWCREKTCECIIGEL